MRVARRRRATSVLSKHALTCCCFSVMMWFHALDSFRRIWKRSIHAPLFLAIRNLYYRHAPIGFSMTRGGGGKIHLNRLHSPTIVLHIVIFLAVICPCLPTYSGKSRDLIYPSPAGLKITSSAYA